MTVTSEFFPHQTHQPVKHDRDRLVQIIGTITFVVVIATTILMIASAFRDSNPVLMRMAFTQITPIILVGWGRAMSPTKPFRKVLLLLGGVAVMNLGFALFINSEAIQAALTTMIYAILLGSVAGTGQTSERIISIGTVFAWLTAMLSLVIRVERINLVVAQYLFPVLIAGFAIIYTTMLTMETVTAPLRVRLIMGGLSLVFIPLFSISIIQNYQVQSSVYERLQDSLTSAAEQTKNRVDEWLLNNRDYVSRDSSLATFSAYLSLDPAKRSGSQEEVNLLLTFHAIQRRPQKNLIAYGLLDSNGEVVYDINPLEMMKFELGTDYFTQSIRGNHYISDILFSSEDSKPYIFISSPVYDNDLKTVGVLRAKFDADIFQTLIIQSTNLVGEKTLPILLDENQMRLADALSPTSIYKTLAPISPSEEATLLIRRRLNPQQNFVQSTDLTEVSKLLSNHPNLVFFTSELTPNAGKEKANELVAANRLTMKPWTVLYVQEVTVLTDLATAQQETSTLIAIILAGLVTMATSFVARGFTQPIANLIVTAEKITTGDLSVSARVTNDELGTLASAFNLMTARLRQFINELEDRVRERTHELAERNEALTYRTRQLQTISEVGKSIASSQELASLLNDVTQLVSERFGFYHVGIFLIDGAHEYAVLSAANSTGGQRMLARQHKLKVGQVGIVGFVTGNGQPRIATDVGADAVYFSNPDLPQTRSEMALPLITNNAVIGALDVQSTKSNAFTELDIELFTALADQIAVAILNSRAYEETKRALAEAQLVHQRYLQQEWAHEAEQRKHMTYEYTPNGVLAREKITTPEIEDIFSTGEAVIRAKGDQVAENDPAVLGVPIKLRGETIGIIHLQDQNAQARNWSDDEVEAVQAVADQVAQALENARLFEQTVRRAEREKKVLEITSKIRTTTDPEAMMQIAVEELQRALRASRTQVILNVPAAQSADGPAPQPSTNNSNQPGDPSSGPKNNGNGNNGNTGSTGSQGRSASGGGNGKNGHA